MSRLLALALGLALSIAAASPTAAGTSHGLPSWRGAQSTWSHADRLRLPPRAHRDLLSKRQRVIVPPLRPGFRDHRLRRPPLIVQSRVLSPGVVVNSLLRRGFERIRLVQLRPGLVRVHAVDPHGRRVMLLIDAFTSRVLKRDVLRR